MEIDRLNRWLALTANIGVLIGIIFLALEIQQSSRLVQAEQIRSRTNDTFNYRSQYNEYADIWTKGSAGAELTPSELSIFDNLLMMRWGQAFAVSSAAEELNGPGIMFVALRDFAGLLFRNPGARERWLLLMEEEQEVRRILIPVPMGVEYLELIISDLEKLDTELL